ncbi:MAG: hypothetical protein AAGA66_00910 [Bacteroidota bacterium]
MKRKRYLMSWVLITTLLACQTEKASAPISSTQNERCTFRVRRSSETADASNKPAGEAHLLTLSLEIDPLDGNDLTEAMPAFSGQREAAIHYLSFRFKDAVRLVAGRDTLEVAVFHFERSFDLKPGRTFHLTFDLSGLNETPTAPFLVVDAPPLGEKIVLKLTNLQMNR